MKTKLALVVFSVVTSLGYAQNKTIETIDSLKIDSELLDEVVIKSSHFKSGLKTIPSSISVLNQKELTTPNSVNIAPILNTVPGVFMHNGTLTTNRITIRGIGSRNLFGTSKIRAYYQDIPLTNGSGFSTIEDIEVSTLGTIEVLKGPSSSLYGSGLGGTIHLIPYKNILNKSAGNIEYLVGSFGLQKWTAKADIGTSNGTTSVIYSNLNRDGYRDNNNTSRQTVTLNSQYELNQNNNISVLATFIDLKAFIPSSLNEDDYLNNPTKAAFTWGSAKGYEDYKKGLLGVSWQHKYSDKSNQSSSVFTTFLDSYEPRPFNILQEKTTGLGFRTRFNSKTTLFNKTFEYVFGVELFADSNEYQTFENLYKDFPPEIGSVQGELLSDLNEKRSYYNVFLDSKFHFSDKTILSIGLNLNQTFYKLSDYFNDLNENVSGNYKYDLIASPKIGLTHNHSESSMFYGSISHGFSVPSLEETLLPNGLINTNIQPESGWNFEIGTRGEFCKNNFYDITLFRMNVNDLLVARRTADDQYIGINAGETTYNGLEFATHHRIIQNETFTLLLRNALTFNDFKFKEFIDDDNDYSGNQLTGVPKFTFNSNVTGETTFGLYFNLNYNYVGAIPIKDDNSIYSDKYQLVNTKIGFKTAITNKLNLNIYGGINNIFDEQYASMLLINAGSFGGNAPRYYYPGEPTNYYGTLQLNYQL